MGANAGTNAAYAQPANGMFGGFGQQQYPQQPQYQPQYQQYPAQQAYQQQQFSPYMGQYSPYMGQYGQQQYQPQAYNQQSMMGYGPANPFMTGLGMSAYSQGYPMSYMGGLGAMQNPFMGMMGGYGMGGYGGGYGMGGYGMPMGGYGMGGGGGGYGPPTNNDPMHLIDIPGFGARNSLDYGMVAPMTATPTESTTSAATTVPAATTTATPTTATTPTAAAPDATTKALNDIYQQSFGRAYNPSTDSYWANQIASGKESLSDIGKLQSDIGGGATGTDLTAYQKAMALTPVTAPAGTPAPILPSNVSPGYVANLNSVRANPAEESALQGAAAAGIPGFTVYKRGGAV